MAKKKGKVAVVIALKPLGGVAPKKPEDTANVGVKKGNVGDCPKCGMTGYLPCVTCDRYARKAVGVEKTPRKCKNCNCSRSECVCKAGYC